MAEGSRDVYESDDGLFIANLRIQLHMYIHVSLSLATQNRFLHGHAGAQF